MSFNLAHMYLNKFSDEPLNKFSDEPLSAVDFDILVKLHMNDLLEFCTLQLHCPLHCVSSTL